MTTRRVDRGRYHSYVLDGRTVPGVTTVLRNGVPKPALVNWAAKEVATYAAQKVDILGGLEHDEIVDFLKGAPWRDRDKAARRGTEVHRLAEQLVVGADVEVPDELSGHVDAYLDFVDRWEPNELHVESVVVNRRWGYMGTLDLIAELDGLGVCLLDVKTGSGVYPETALQLAGYRYADTIIEHGGGGELPMPRVDWCGVIHVRADGWDLLPVTAGVDEFQTFLHAHQVGKWLTDRADGVIGVALEPPPPVLEVVQGG